MTSDNIFLQPKIDRHLYLMLDMASVPMMISRADGTLEYMNSALVNLLGYQSDEINQPDFVIYHQDEFYLDDKVRRAIEADLTVPAVLTATYEHRSGDAISARITIVPQLDEEGTVLRFISQIEDGVENKETDGQLQLASLVFAKSSEGMMVTDEKGVILDVNSAFTKITGYLKDEVYGKNASMLSSGQQDDLFYKLMWKSINTSGHWKGEIWNRRKEGEDYPIIISINTDFDNHGKVNKRVALFSDLTDIKAKEKQIFQQAYYDSVTGLPNRELFIERLNHILNLKKSRSKGIALLLLDLDGFKEVNDTLGHETGNELLKLVTERLLQCVKYDDVVARLGGDEFTVIMQNVSELETVTQNILKKLARPFIFENEEIYISASVGISLFPDDSEQVSELLKNAEQAMYAVKKQGRNGYRFFTPSMQQEAQDRLVAINEIREAIEKKQFILHYQPIVKLATNEIYKAEALVRWEHPEKGVISPDQFIPIAEETGQIIGIGKWVVNEALQQVYVWREAYCSHFQLSVNESPLQFKSDENSFREWFACLEKLDLPGDAVSIEITENLLMDFSESVDVKMQKLKDAHIQISLDDFGTGYASLSYLKRFDIEFLKIDKSYVQSMERDKNVMILCESIIQMAHKLNIQVIAEGIETQKQLNILKSLNCDFGQGYLFSRPIAVDEFEQLLSGKKQMEYLI